MTAPAPKTKTICGISADLRLTTDDLARLNPEQIAAVFDGIGKVAAVLAGAQPTEPGEPPADTSWVQTTDIREDR